jgi:hypothetical protein
MPFTPASSHEPTAAAMPIRALCSFPISFVLRISRRVRSVGREPSAYIQASAWNRFRGDLTAPRFNRRSDDRQPQPRARGGRSGPHDVPRCEQYFDRQRSSLVFVVCVAPCRNRVVRLVTLPERRQLPATGAMSPRFKGDLYANTSEECLGQSSTARITTTREAITHLSAGVVRGTAQFLLALRRYPSAPLCVRPIRSETPTVRAGRCPATASPLLPG